MAKTLHWWCLLTNLSSHCWDHSQTIPSMAIHWPGYTFVKTTINFGVAFLSVTALVLHEAPILDLSFKKWHVRPKYLPPSPKLSTKKGKQQNVMVLDPYPTNWEYVPWTPTSLSILCQGWTYTLLHHSELPGSRHHVWIHLVHVQWWWHTSHSLSIWRLKLLFSSSIFVCSKGLHLSDNHTEQRCTAHGRTHITLPKNLANEG